MNHGIQLSIRGKGKACFIRAGFLLKDSEEHLREARISSGLVAVSEVKFEEE